jgi:predicted ATP-grasp superfamily ATP-dependent carboligase
MGEMMTGDPAAAARVVKAFMPMVKLDIAALEKAYQGS